MKVKVVRTKATATKEILGYSTTRDIAEYVSDDMGAHLVHVGDGIFRISGGLYSEPTIEVAVREVMADLGINTRFEIEEIDDGVYDIRFWKPGTR